MHPRVRRQSAGASRRRGGPTSPATATGTPYRGRAVHPTDEQRAGRSKVPRAISGVHRQDTCRTTQRIRGVLCGGVVRGAPAAPTGLQSCTRVTSATEEGRFSPCRDRSRTAIGTERPRADLAGQGPPSWLAIEQPRAVRALPATPPAQLPHEYDGSWARLFSNQWSSAGCDLAAPCSVAPDVNSQAFWGSPCLKRLDTAR